MEGVEIVAGKVVSERNPEMDLDEEFNKMYGDTGSAQEDADLDAEFEKTYGQEPSSVPAASEDSTPLPSKDGDEGEVVQMSHEKPGPRAVSTTGGNEEKVKPLRWEDGDGGEERLPDGERNQWGGNLRNEGRKVLFRRNKDGKVIGYSTTSSMLVRHDDGKFAVVPTVVGGKELSQEEAVKHYAETGEHWGMADDEESAQKMAQEVHDTHMKGNQAKWNDWIHENWDKVSDEIRSDRGTAYEHEKRTAPDKTQKASAGVEYGKIALETAKGAGEGWIQGIGEGTQNVIHGGIDFVGSVLNSIGRGLGGTPTFRQVAGTDARTGKPTMWAVRRAPHKGETEDGKDERDAPRRWLDGIGDAIIDYAEGLKKRNDERFHASDEFFSNLAGDIMPIVATGGLATPTLVANGYADNYDNLYKQARESGKSHEEADRIASTGGVINAAIMGIVAKGPLKTWVGKRFGQNVARALGKSVMDGEANSMSGIVRSGTKWLFKNTVKDVGVSTVESGLLFGGQAAFNEGASEYARGEDVDPMKITMAGYEGAKSGVAMSLAMGGVQLIGQRAQYRRDVEDAAWKRTKSPRGATFNAMWFNEGTADILKAEKDGTLKNGKRFRDLKDRSGLPSDMTAKEAEAYAKTLRSLGFTEENLRFFRRDKENYKRLGLREGDVSGVPMPDNPDVTLPPEAGASELMARELRSRGIEPVKFTVPSQPGADGRPVPRFTKVNVKDNYGGVNGVFNIAIDENAKVAIIDNGDGTYTAYDSYRNSETADSIDEAIEKAQMLALIQQVQNSDRQVKEQVIRTEAEKYGKWDTLYYPTMEDAANAVDKLIAENGGKWNGLTDTSFLRTPDKAGRDAFYVSDNRNGGKKHGVAFLILDNINGVEDIPRILGHEHVGHGGPNAEFGGSGGAVEFAKNVRSKEFEAFKKDVVSGARSEVRARDMEAVNRNLGEVFAHYAAANLDREPSNLDKLVSAVNGAARKLKLRKTYSSADVKTMMARWKTAGRGEGGIVEGRADVPERFEFFPVEERKTTTEVKDETGNVRDEAPAQPEQGAPEPAGGEAARPVEAQPQGGEAPRRGAVEPAKTGSDAAEAPTEAPPPMRTEHDFLRVMHDNQKPVRVPVGEIALPDTQFKEGADPKTGVVKGQELKGEYFESAENAVVVYVRKDGTKELVTGRHRFDLAKRNGKNDILARVFRESDGYTPEDMRNLDAISNIIDEKGTEHDYIRYFENAKPSRAAAEAAGFLSRSKGRLAFELYEGATEGTRAAVDWSGSGADGLISPEQAGIIAKAAPRDAHPRNGAVQRILVKKAQDGLRGDRLAIVARSLAEEAKRRKAPAADGETQLDLFTSEEDQALLALEEKRAARRVQKANEYGRVAGVLQTAMQKGGRLDLNKAYAKELGIKNPKDRKQLADARQKALEKAEYWRNAVRLDEADKAALDAELGIAPKENLELESVTGDQIAEENRKRAEKEEIERRKAAPLKGGAGEVGQSLMDLGGAEGEDLFNRTQRQEPVATESSVKRRYTREPIAFSKPFVGRTGARLVGYEWPNEGEEYVDKRGNDRVRYISDWNYSEVNGETGRDIVHKFHVEMPDGERRTVSAESAAKLLGVSTSQVKGEGLKQIRKKMAVESLPDAQKATFERITRNNKLLKDGDSVALMRDGTLRILGFRGKADGVYDRWNWHITTISPDGSIKERRLATKPGTKGFELDHADIVEGIRPTSAQTRENGPVSAPKEAGATTPPKAEKPAEGRKSGDAEVLKENLTAETPAKPVDGDETSATPKPLDGYLAGKKPIETHRIPQSAAKAKPPAAEKPENTTGGGSAADAGRDARKVVGTDYTVARARELLREDVEARIADAAEELGADLRVVGVDLHGSRVRGDARPDSDLDLVVEYEGDAREDDLFDALNADPIDFHGIRVDVNPIRADKTGTLAEYMARSDGYDREKLAAKPAAPKPKAKAPSVRMKDEAAERKAKAALDAIDFDKPELGVREKQTALSGGTSRNQNPSGNEYGRKWKIFRPSTRNVDIGAGRFDKATQFLADIGVENIPFDPVNRDGETNRRAAESVRANPADTATVHNVLNVIDNDSVMEGIVNQAARAIKKNGSAIFTIYEGNRSGVGARTRDGYQRNAKARSYEPTIKKFFGSVETHGNVILARRPKDIGPAFWAFDSSFENGIDFDTPDFDPERFGKLVTGVGKLVDVLVESGHREFKALATYIYERDAEKYGRAKPVLQAIWNAVARARGLSRVGDAEADSTFASVENPESQESKEDQARRIKSSDTQALILEDAKTSDGETQGLIEEELLSRGYVRNRVRMPNGTFRYRWHPKGNAVAEPLKTPVGREEAAGRGKMRPSARTRSRAVSVASDGATWRDASGKERKWPGFVPPSALLPKEGLYVAVQSGDGAVFIGKVAKVTEGGVELQPQDDEAARTFPLDAVVGVRDPAAPARRRSVARPAGEVDFYTPGLYTGSAADYERPSLHYVGTGEGNQVYGWGLYASDRRGVAEGYANSDAKRRASTPDEMWPKYKGKFDSELEHDPVRTFALKYVAREGSVDAAIQFLRTDDWTERADPKAREAAEWLEKNRDDVTPPQTPSEHLYEQTWFTDRAPGDESHLLKWYEPVSEEQKAWIEEQAKKEGFVVGYSIRGEKYIAGPNVGGLANSESGIMPEYWQTGEDAYRAIGRLLGSPKAASEFLARAGIDGVKYPVDSYGKAVKDGDETGWNYVSFRDDNIRVDHKWADGEIQFDTPELSPEGRREHDEVVARYTNADGTKKPGWMKAPNGKPTKLTERQWVQVRTPSFKKWFGDWERLAELYAARDFALNSEPVAEVSGNDFQKDPTGANTLIDRVADYFAELGGKAESPDLGTVELTRRGVKSSVAHGIGAKKAAAFAAVKDVIEKGVVFDRNDDWKGRGYATAAIAAPIRMGGKDYVCELIVNRYKDRNAFYLHEVNLKEKLSDTIKTATGAVSIGESARPVMSIIAQRLAEVNPASVSKVVDENGEPLVVYRGAEFDPLAQEPGKGIIRPEAYFTADPEYARQYTGNGGKVRAYYLNIRRPFDIRDPECLNDLRKVYPDHEFQRGTSGALDWAEASVVDGEFLEENFGDKYDGIIYDEGGVPTDSGAKHRGVSFVPVYGGAQIKSATDNTGAFDAANPDIRFDSPELDPMRRAEEVNTYARRYYERHKALHALESPTRESVMDAAEGRWQKLRRALQDKNLVIREVEERLGVTDKKQSVYYAKDREFGLNEHQLGELQRRRVEPIFDALADVGVGQEAFDLYLIARHAPYRNALVRGRNGTENGSGMSDADADAVIGRFRALGVEGELARIADMVYDMNDEALQRLVDSGRLSQEDADGFRAAQADYVPLRTDMEDADRDAFNTSTSGWKKNEFHAAKGRDTLADSPLAWSIVQAERAIKASNANVTRQAAAALVRHAEKIGKPIGEIVPAHKFNKRWAFDIGDEVWTADALKDRPDLIFFKEDGRLKAIKVDGGKNALGITFAKAVTDKDLVQFSKWFEWVPKLTRAMSAMRTQYVPTFILRNMKADTLEAMLNVFSERGLRPGLSFGKRLLASEWKNRKDVKDYFRTGEARGWMKEFVENGGLTGGGMAAEGFSEAAKRIQKTLRKHGGGARGLAAAVPDAISLLNACAEYNTRLGIYTVLREEGVGVEDAISYARDATVNFNRKGYLTPYTNAAFMFSNAAIQGMSRAFKSMGAKHGKGTLAALFMVGVIQTLLDHWLGDDDDREKKGLSNAKNMTEHDKQTSLGVPLPGGRRLKAQIRNPWALPVYLGRKTAELAIGAVSAARAAKDVASAVGGFITEPVGGNGFDSISQTWQTFAPTLADPLVQWMTGTDFKGDERLRKKWDDNLPSSWNGRRNTAAPYKWIAQGLNALSGGGEFRKGAFDTSPENWQLLAETVLGGALTDLNRVASAVADAWDAAQGAKPDQVLRDVPFVRDTVTNMPDVSRRYYESFDAYDADRTEFRGVKGADGRLAFAARHPWVMDDRVKRLDKEIRELGKMEQGLEKKGGEWVAAERTPKERLEFRRKRLAKMAEFVGIMEEKPSGRLPPDAEYRILTQAFSEAKKEYETIQKDPLLETKHRKSILDEMRGSNPLLVDKVRLDVEDEIKEVKKSESELKKMREDGTPEKYLKDAETNLQKLKDNVLKLIRENRRAE